VSLTIDDFMFIDENSSIPLSTSQMIDLGTLDVVALEHRSLLSTENALHVFGSEQRLFDSRETSVSFSGNRACPADAVAMDWRILVSLAHKTLIEWFLTQHAVVTALHDAGK
jgi:hypothetical protein